MTYEEFKKRFQEIWDAANPEQRARLEVFPWEIIIQGVEDELARFAQRH